MASIQKITPNLWFDGQAEEAANYYINIFKNSSLGRITHYGKEGIEITTRNEGNFQDEGTRSFHLSEKPTTEVENATNP